MPTPFDHALAAIIVLGLPLRAWFGYRRLLAAGDDALPVLRPKLYARAIASQWALAGAVLALWIWQHRGWDVLGLVVRPGIALGGIGVGVAFVLPAVLRQRAQVAADRELRARVRERLEGAMRLMPRTDAQHRLFNVLAVTAGFCEELLYRGFLAWFAAHWLPPLAAHAVVAVAFGVGHAYQGSRGMVRTGFAGAFFSALTLVTGTVWPAMALHAGMDLLAGDLGRRVADPDGEAAAESAS